MADIFISYAREDHERVHRLANVLEGKGYSVWWDREIAPGETFASVIERELHGAKCVFAIWSSRSIDSQWVRDEASEAARLGTLIPVTVDGVLPPLGFRQVQAADLTAWYGTGSNSDEGLLHLLSAVRQRVAGTAAPEWQLPKTAPTSREGRSWAVKGLLVAVLAIIVGGGTLGTYVVYQERERAAEFEAKRQAELEAKRQAQEESERQKALLDYFQSIPKIRIRIGVVELSNVTLSPPPPASVLEREQVRITFRYEVCCNATVHIWIRPIITGSNCRYGASGSPLYEGSGNGESDFNLRGTECRSARVDALQIRVKNEENGKQEDYQLKVQYTVR